MQKKKKNKYLKWLMKSRKACLVVLPVVYILSIVIYSLACLVIDMPTDKKSFWVSYIWAIIVTYSIHYWFRFISNNGPRDGARGVSYVFYPMSIAIMCLILKPYIHQIKSEKIQVEQITAETIGEHEFIKTNQPLNVDTAHMSADYMIELLNTDKNSDNTFCCKAYAVVPIKNSNGVYFGFIKQGKVYKDVGYVDYASAENELTIELNTSDLMGYIDKDCRLFEQASPSNNPNYENWKNACLKSDVPSSHPRILLPTNRKGAARSATPTLDTIAFPLFILAIVMILQLYFCWWITDYDD